MPYAIAWLTTAIAFAVLDALWLSQAAPRIYRPLLGDMLADSVRWAPAIAFYLIYISGIVFFAVAPALERGGWRTALIGGALLGLVAYATYDLTNHATLRVWDIRVTLIDMAWGAFASALAAGAGLWAAQRFG